MVTDTQLTAFANGVCCIAMVLIVAYHFVTVNAEPVINFFKYIFIVSDSVTNAREQKKKMVE